MEGSLLVEFFSVIYLGLDEIKPAEQIGTIKVNDQLNVHYLYNVDKVDITMSSIQHGDEILLGGPITAPILGGVTVLDVDLFCGTYKDTMHFDYLPNYMENEPLKRIITSKDGTGKICVLYTLFKNAIAASVEVEMTCVDSTSVYGVVAAGTKLIELPEYKSLLFSKKPIQKIKLSSGDMIPLSRSLVAVPLNSFLFVDVHLCDDSRDDPSDDSTITMGTLKFSPPSETCQSEQTLLNQKSEIKIKVLWKSAALTSCEKDIRARNKLTFVLDWMKETDGKPDTSVYPL